MRGRDKLKTKLWYVSIREMLLLNDAALTVHNDDRFRNTITASHMPAKMF